MSDDEFQDHEKANIFQFLYRHTGMSRDQVYAALDSKGYREAYRKIADAYKITESIEDVAS